MSNCISISGLEMQFAGCNALRGIDLNIARGSVFALLGENGAGKTTLIRILTGFQQPTAGRSSVCGFDPQVDALQIRKRIGYVSDQPALYDWMRVDEIGWFTAAFYADGFLDRYGESIAHFDLPRSRKIKNLSKGQRAKVALALALAHDPELLILDEPTSGLDPHVRREFMESMVDRAVTGRTVLLSSHQIAEVERVADNIAILHQGKVRLCDSMSAIKETISEVTISLDDSLVALPKLDPKAEVLQEQASGRQRRLIVRGFDSAVQTQLESRAGIASVRSRPASLEEVFIACTRGESSSNGNRANAPNRSAPSPLKSMELLTGGEYES
jgi:ABC-2 type transport system ATP-binding protein